MSSCSNIFVGCFLIGSTGSVTGFLIAFANALKPLFAIPKPLFAKPNKLSTIDTVLLPIFDLVNEFNPVSATPTKLSTIDKPLFAILDIFGGFFILCAKKLS